MGQHRDLKINYDSLKAIQAIVKKYKDALEDLQESTNTFADVIKAQDGDAFKELETEFEEDISVDYSSLISILGDVDTNIGNYMTDMTSYITPEDSSVICRVDRNDIWWNLQQIQGIPYGYLNSYPGVPSHWYMDEWVNPFADDADEVRARNAENQRKRERNYDKLNDFFNNSLKNTAQELWNETESIKSIYDNYVVSYENTDDTYSVKMNSIYYSIASLLDLLKDEVDTRIDFLRGFATGFVDLLKGLKAPLEIALAINPAIPLPPGVRAELLIDGTNEIYQGVKVFINDPENTIGAMFQGMFDTGDEEGTAFCVGYATEKVVEVIVAKKVADAMAGPKVKTEVPKTYPKATLETLKNTENFTDSALEHIFEGQINRRGNAVGYHYECIEGTQGRIVPGTEVPMNDLGVYKAQVEVGGIPKTGNAGFSTLFPKNMSPQEIINTINEANEVKVLKTGNEYYGYASNGMKISMYINKAGKVISAFPAE